MCKLSPEDLPGSLLPSQYFAHVRRRQLFNGEYRLLLAVLEDAIRSYLSNLGARRGEERAILAEVRVWFFARGNFGKQGLFAFESICELLGIEPDIVRKRLAGISIRDLSMRRYRSYSLTVARFRTRRHRITTPPARAVEQGHR